MSDIRISGWDLSASAGTTVELEFTSNEALTSLAIYTGGNLDDLDDLTEATAFTATLSGGNLVATVDLDVPTGEATPLRLVVNDVVQTVGFLRPSTSGVRAVQPGSIALTPGSYSFTLNVLGIVGGGGGSGTDDQTAAEVSFTPAGGLAATDVQGALEELDSEKSPTSHNHDGVYSAVAHTHDDRYYTETEVDTALAGKSDTGHDHAGVYDPAGTASSAIAAHEASVNPHPDYLTAAEGNAAYASVSHDHDADYEALGAVATHEADTTNVHGIADTSALLTDADLAAVATTGAYADLSGLPTLGTAADNDEGDFAAAAHNHNGVYADADGEYPVNTVAASGSTETLTLAPAHRVTMDQNCTFTFPAPSAGHTFLLLLSGAFTPTFPASVDWDSATAPTYASPSLYGFTTLDGGTTWAGTLIASGLG